MTARVGGKSACKDAREKLAAGRVCTRENTEQKTLSIAQERESAFKQTRVILYNLHNALPRGKKMNPLLLDTKKDSTKSVTGTKSRKV